MKHVSGGQKGKFRLVLDKRELEVGRGTDWAKTGDVSQTLRPQDYILNTRRSGLDRARPGSTGLWFCRSWLDGFPNGCLRTLWLAIHTLACRLCMGCWPVLHWAGWLVSVLLLWNHMGLLARMMGLWADIRCNFSISDCFLGSMVWCWEQETCQSGGRVNADWSQRALQFLCGFENWEGRDTWWAIVSSEVRSLGVESADLVPRGGVWEIALGEACGLAAPHHLSHFTDWQTVLNQAVCAHAYVCVHTGVQGVLLVRPVFLSQHLLQFSEQRNLNKLKGSPGLGLGTAELSAPWATLLF